MREAEFEAREDVMREHGSQQRDSVVREHEHSERMAGETTRRIAGTPRWKHAHDELVRIARTRTKLDRDEGGWLLVAAREGTHARLGYASFAEYVERLFGYSPRYTLEKLRVAKALEELPETSRSFHDGALNWSIARELTRVATRETEAAWLEASSRKTAREVERLVSGHARGSKPSDAPDDALRRHVIRLEISGATLASFREAMAKLRRDAGEPLDDDAAVFLLSRFVLAGSADTRDTGRGSYEVSVTRCEHCRRGFQKANGELVEVTTPTVEMAACDSRAADERTHVGVGNSRRATQRVRPSVRRRVLARDSGRCSVPGCRHAVFVDVHHVDPKAEGGGHDVGNLVTLCAAHHRAAHLGRLIIDRANDGFRFWHGDGTEYGSRLPSPTATDARSAAFRALRALGFGETESKRALASARSASDSDTEAMVRAALAILVSAA